MTDQLLTARAVSDKLGISVETVLRWAASGKLPSIRLSSRAIRFREEAIDAWVAERESGAAPRGVSATQSNRAHGGEYAPAELHFSVSAIPPRDVAATTEEDS